MADEDINPSGYTGKRPLNLQGQWMKAYVTRYFPKSVGNGKGIGYSGYVCVPGLACAANTVPQGTIIRFEDDSPSPVKYDLLVCDKGEDAYFGTKEQRAAANERPGNTDFLNADICIDIACYPMDGPKDDDTFESTKPIVKTGLHEVYVFTEGSNQDIEKYRQWLWSNLGASKEADNTHAVGNASAGTETTVPNLLKLMTSLNFIRGFVDGAQTGTFTMADLIEQQLSKVHCHLYTIPNIYKGKNLVAKPELLFQKAPTCNIILPQMKEGIYFSYSMKERPTRMVIAADPLSLVSNTKTVYNMYGVSYIGQTKLYDAKESPLGVPVYKLQFESPNSANYTKFSPVLTNITNFEVNNGIYCGKKNVGSELALYTTTYTSDLKTKQKLSWKPSDPNSSAAGKMLQEVANYELAKDYYAKSGGSIQMYFDPYLVAGFPFVSVEKTKMSLCIHGYITNIVHELSHESMRTLVTYSCGHLDNEHPPEVYPIYEEEYTTNLAQTYQNLLGPSVLPVQEGSGDGGTISEMQKLAETEPTLSECFAEVWRETQSLEEWMTDVADNAKLDTSQTNFWSINNNDEIMSDESEEGKNKRFFNKELQERIQNYTKQVLAGRPFHVSEVN